MFLHIPPFRPQPFSLLPLLFQLRLKVLIFHQFPVHYDTDGSEFVITRFLHTLISSIPVEEHKLYVMGEESHTNFFFYYVPTY